ncbi:hypothetical protein TNCV_283011 [Trichonephila clavipes]|nr:hypothetical protein TNCV_283011 [Trichonephila clavipes]
MDRLSSLLHLASTCTDGRTFPVSVSLRVARLHFTKSRLWYGINDSLNGRHECRPLKPRGYGHELISGFVSVKIGDPVLETLETHHVERMMHVTSEEIQSPHVGAAWKFGGRGTKLKYRLRHLIVFQNYEKTPEKCQKSILSYVTPPGGLSQIRVPPTYQQSLIRSRARISGKRQSSEVLQQPFFPTRPSSDTESLDGVDFG